MLRVLLLLGALSAGAVPPASAQIGPAADEPAPDWRPFSPPGDEFTVELPAAPDLTLSRRSIQGGRPGETEAARIYVAYHGGVVFLVAALDNPRPRETLDFLAAQFFGRLGLSAARATFGGEVLSGHVRGWRYEVTLGAEKGAARLFLTSAHVYLAAAVGGDESHAAAGRFLNSFKLSATAAVGERSGDEPPRAFGREARKVVPAPPAAAGADPPPRPALPVSPQPPPADSRRQQRDTPGQPVPADGPPDYTQPFKPAEVARRAVVVFHPSPGYTEEARRNNVSGLVRLRGVLTAQGGVKNVSVIKGLPDGLTEKAIAAARAIRFIPAVKDGRRVSQWVTLEYNFNIHGRGWRLVKSVEAPPQAGGSPGQ